MHEGIVAKLAWAAGSNIHKGCYPRIDDWQGGHGDREQSVSHFSIGAQGVAYSITFVPTI